VDGRHEAPGQTVEERIAAASVTDAAPEALSGQNDG
jgi:hypothetical protein